MIESIRSRTGTQKVFRIIFAALATLICTNVFSSTILWRLDNFLFDDGGTAYGTFEYDSATRRLTSIDIYTTTGSVVVGKHYVATAGLWGSRPDLGIFAFSDRSGPDYMDASWFRFDVTHGFNAGSILLPGAILANATPGTIVHLRTNVGAESFCVNAVCSSAANELTNPGETRKTLSGQLFAVSVVPELAPAPLLLVGSLIVAFAARRRYRREVLG